MEFKIRFWNGHGVTEVPCMLLSAGDEARDMFEGVAEEGVYVLLGGDRDYAARVETDATGLGLLQAGVGRRVSVRFPERSSVRRLLEQVRVVAARVAPPEADPDAAPAAGAAVEITPSLLLEADGRFVRRAAIGSGSEGLAAHAVLIDAARWVSTRRTTTFESLFPPSAFHPDLPVRQERLSVAQASGLLGQLEGALGEASVTGPLAAEDLLGAAQVRSAAATILSHLVATVLKDPSFREVADRAADMLVGIAEVETGQQAVPALRAHVIQLLQLRGAALSTTDRARAINLLRTLVRVAPPYEELSGPWRFAVCSDYEFHDGECNILLKNGFRELPGETSGMRRYRVFEAPFRNPSGETVQFWSRAASPGDENAEMGDAGFVGLLINRHAQLGIFDMRASATTIRQAGYKLMMNSQCAGLTTRYAISRLFPDADIYSSWDSTYFRTGPDRVVSASEGMDCFLAVVKGMVAREDHAALSRRVRAAQWYHEGANFPGFVQFVGPASPQVIARFSDVNLDGKADRYDGYLDLSTTAVGESIEAAGTPRDPGVDPSAIGGEAGRGLDWAAGSLNRVLQYSDLWDGLPGSSELLHPFESGGFYDHQQVPGDILGGQPGEDAGRLPALARFLPIAASEGGLRVEMMMHAWLSHAPAELKRLLTGAEAVNRAFDTGILPARGLLATPQGRRGMVLLTLAGLLDFPADANQIDLLWQKALQMLRFPPLSRSLVRGCISSADHDASNYYGSLRGLGQLVGTSPGDTGAVGKSDPLAWKTLASEDPAVGRAAPLEVP